MAGIRITPSAALQRGERLCGECQSGFVPIRHDQVFCSKACRFANHNRAMQRGREAYRAIYHWRLGHGKGQRGSLISTISEMAKRWVEEDRGAGRSAPPLPEDMLLRLQNARTGYVKEKHGMSYRHDPEAAVAVVTELQT
jgi:hypothetical protein